MLPQPKRARCHGGGARPSAASSPHEKEGQETTHTASGDYANLPDDALAGIFSLLPRTADAVCCAATCSKWARAADLSRALPSVGRFVPGLAVGLFHQEKDQPVDRTRTRSVPAAPGAAQPSFLALPSTAGRRTCLPQIDGICLDYARPVASRNGRLVLEIRRTGDLAFCVCNPMTGETSMLPELTGDDGPTDYGCALLTTADLALPPRRSTPPKPFFRLLFIYNRPNFTALRCYSSDTSRWEPETCAVLVSPREMRHIGRSVVRRGAAFWPLDQGALGVRLAAHELDRAVDVHLLPYYASPHYWPERHLLGVSPEDDRLFFVHFSVHHGRGTLFAGVSYFHIPEDDDIEAGREVLPTEHVVMMPKLGKMTWRCTTIKLRWVGEKSGVVLFTIQGGEGGDGTFALSLRDETVEKVVAGEGHEWRNMVGFEMDNARYLASLHTEKTDYDLTGRL